MLRCWRTGWMAWCWCIEVGEARKAVLRHAKGLFDQAHARTLGLVFNKIGQGISQGYHYYYTSGASYYTDDESASTRTASASGGSASSRPLARTTPTPRKRANGGGDAAPVMRRSF